ncbi:putative membrane protein [Saccharopolyspora lacisalsi]|uniref:Putative membrane protein n=1 Tax=Halosaccharopolyspora lacisalsi TaxID=1000566 RepID=A0A839E3U1_9PSEU|nr:SdpI family protein [Halosaccharopolyspora lacisalsi]MBA8827710.1 putative membrane protein [Halosaccharopolyspora lacisalsi]
MTLAVQITCCAVLVLGGATLLVLGRRGLHGTLPRNRFVGVRTPAALRNDEAFELGNRVAAPAMLAGGAVGVLSGAMLPLLPSTSSVVMVALIGAVGTFGLMTAGGVLGARAAQALPEPANPCAGCAGSCALVNQSPCGT